MHGALHLVPGRGRSRPRRSASWLAPVSLAVAVVALLVVLAYGRWSGRRAILALAPEERQVVLSRTVDDLRRWCGGGRPDGLRDHCRELAAFAARFEECRGDCEALARHLLAPNPTR